ncbi:MAG: ATP-dependent sacrificial sulfur transferase LarE [Nitrospirae bacterium]|nr:ATP-dependent sacrificial sulfur transferase LarE [Nitrospirota bacterium]
MGVFEPATARDEGSDTTRGLDQKYGDLKAGIQAFERVLVAFSGGVDSAFVLKTARDLLGAERVIALTALSDTVPEHDRRDAARITGELGVEHLVIATRHMEIEDFVRNDADRCYFCKTEVYTTCGRIAEERGIPVVADGTNADDLGDIRPGLKAAREIGVRSPLAEAGLSKSEIRELGRRVGLDVWDRPASPCLSSRFPQGTRITVENLTRVGRSESLLRKLGFREFRVRLHEDIARIEVSPEEFDRLNREPIRRQVVAGLKEEGFKYVCLDLEEFKSGRLSRA